MLVVGSGSLELVLSPVVARGAGRGLVRVVAVGGSSLLLLPLGRALLLLVSFVVGAAAEAADLGPASGRGVDAGRGPEGKRRRKV